MITYQPPKTGWGHILLFLLPFFLFIAFAAIVFARITGIPAQTADQIPSVLTDKQAPHTVLPVLTSAAVSSAFDMKNFKGRVTLVNFWGSWCPPCREEHPFLMSLADNPLFNLVGINYKDTRENALRFLGNFGNPFRITGFDPDGRATIDWGVYGSPETFIIGKDGTVLYRHIGPLTSATFKETLMPIIAGANGE